MDKGDDAPAYAKGSGEVFDILLRLSGYGGTGLCFAFGAPERVDLIDALYARDPTTPTDLSPGIALVFFGRRRGELGTFTFASKLQGASPNQTSR